MDQIITSLNVDSDFAQKCQLVVQCIDGEKVTFAVAQEIDALISRAKDAESKYADLVAKNKSTFNAAQQRDRSTVIIDVLREEVEREKQTRNKLLDRIEHLQLDLEAKSKALGVAVAHEDVRAQRDELVRTHETVRKQRNSLTIERDGLKRSLESASTMHHTLMVERDELKRALEQERSTVCAQSEQQDTERRRANAAKLKCEQLQRDLDDALKKRDDALLANERSDLPRTLKQRNKAMIIRLQRDLEDKQSAHLATYDLLRKDRDEVLLERDRARRRADEALAKIVKLEERIEKAENLIREWLDLARQWAETKKLGTIAADSLAWIGRMRVRSPGTWSTNND